MLQKDFRIRWAGFVSCTVLIGALSIPGTAQAATTTFSVATLTDTGSNLDNPATTGNTLLSAVNFTLSSQSSPTPTPTINGIAFTAFNIPSTGQSASYVGSNFTLAGNSTNVIIRDDNRVSGRPTTADIYPLIYNASVSPVASGGVSSMTLTLQNLTVGQPYEVQMVFSSDAAARQVTLNDNAGSGSGTSGAVSYGTTNGPRVITGLFTANATSQAYDIVATTSTVRVQFSGFTLQTVPEPAALGLLAPLGMVLLRRTRRQGA